MATLCGRWPPNTQDQRRKASALNRLASLRTRKGFTVLTQNQRRLIIRHTQGVVPLPDGSLRLFHIVETENGYETAHVVFFCFEDEDGMQTEVIKVGLLGTGKVVEVRTHEDLSLEDALRPLGVFLRTRTRGLDFLAKAWGL